MKPNTKVKAVPVRVWQATEVGEELFWAWETDDLRSNPLLFMETECSAHRHAREFWAAYGCKVRFVK